MSRLIKEEQEILDAFDAGTFTRAPDAENQQGRHRQYAEAMFGKDARINIRLNSKDLRGLQKRALEEGIPYQTLIASILHKYLEGRLREEPCKRPLWPKAERESALNPPSAAQAETSEITPAPRPTDAGPPPIRTPPG